MGSASGNHVVLRGANGRRGNRGFANGAGYFPWYVGYGDYWNDGFDYGPDGPPPESEYQPSASAPPSIIVMQSPQSAPAPRPGASPKVIDVPLSASDGPAKPQPPALFVLQNGQRIESNSYVLSDKSVTVDVGQQRRIIPLSDVNVNETVAANRQRGLDLSIPRDANSLYISF